MNQLYASYYKLVEAGVRSPQSAGHDTFRGVADEKLFPHFKTQICFALLSLDGRGVPYYGDCHMVLHNDMISHRATAFDQNSLEFVGKLRVDEPIPPGYRSAWNKRGILAVAKLAHQIRSSTRAIDFPKILLSIGSSLGHEQFVEVHIYGSITARSLAAIVVEKPKQVKISVRLKALKEKLAKWGIGFAEAS